MKYDSENYIRGLVPPVIVTPERDFFTLDLISTTTPTCELRIHAL